MNKSYDLDIIIPVYNEEKAIKPFFEKIKDVIDQNKINAHIVFVNDGSMDNSKKILGEIGADYLSFEQNLGYGAAIKLGINNTFSNYICIIDCDGTYDPSDIPKLWAEAPLTDMVVGQRPPEKGLRRLSKGILKHFASFAVSAKIPDLNSGLRIMKREMVLKLFNLLPNGFSLTSTITMGAFYYPYRIKYKPISYDVRIGSSKIKPIRAFSGFFILIIRTIILFNPLKFFLPVSILLGSIGLGFLIRDIIHGNLAQTSLLMIVNGFIMLAIGLLAEASKSRI